jgi:hypothetical protein
MNMPFTAREFLEVFERYNEAVYPLQYVLILAALVAIYLSAAHHAARSDRLVSAILAMLWIWAGVVYQWLFFGPINTLAYLFGILFVVQAGIFLYVGVVRCALTFRATPDRRGMTGIIILLYALLIYPLAGALSGHGYPAAPTFGVPCPVTIFTFGILSWTDKRVPAYLLAIPWFGR